MNTIVSALLAATLVAGIATAADAAPKSNGRHHVDNGDTKGCVVTGWTDWPTTHPVFECPPHQSRD